jgi:Na+:H+ antiporter, NhaA family
MPNKPVESFTIRRFINEETIGGVILIICTIIALFWANSRWYDSYNFVWHEMQIGLVWGKINLVASISHWINDGLMALFFFVVGLEIKREVMGGELSSMKKASLPIMAAVGGMVVPALIYAIISINSPEYLNGWGIPMATDIAFALGLLAMLGKNVPISLKIFLTALAIADDLGAVLVIAFFYTDSINMGDLLYGFGFLAVLLIANRMGVRRALFYGLVGFAGVWIAFIFSGVHATIAGVLIALTIPARTKIDEEDYVDELGRLTKKYEETSRTAGNLLTQKQAHILSDIEVLNENAHTPLQRLEHALHPVTTFFILPVFALANAGVRVEGDMMEMILHPISIGIGAGLILGKLLGISLFSWIAVKTKMASLPEGVNWNHIFGVALLAGVGFTMSMFISELAFDVNEHKQIAKVGIICASLIAAISGMVWLIMARSPRTD